jgi:hypothetical protein
MAAAALAAAGALHGLHAGGGGPGPAAAAAAPAGGGGPGPAAAAAAPAAPLAAPPAVVLPAGENPIAVFTAFVGCIAASIQQAINNVGGIHLSPAYKGQSRNATPHSEHAQNSSFRNGVAQPYNLP